MDEKHKLNVDTYYYSHCEFMMDINECDLILWLDYIWRSFGNLNRIVHNRCLSFSLWPQTIADWGTQMKMINMHTVGLFFWGIRVRKIVTISHVRTGIFFFNQCEMQSWVCGAAFEKPTNDGNRVQFAYLL